jgi:hypothetical protein
MSYAADRAEMYRQVGDYTGRMLKGTTGRDLAKIAPCSNLSSSDYANPVSCKLSTRSRSRAVSS